MENADLVIVLVVVAIGAFAGGILFGMWLFKRIQSNLFASARIPGVEYNASGKAIRNDFLPANAVPLSGKYQPTAHSRIGLSNLIRQMEEDDPEAKRHEQIMKANGGN